MQQPYVGRWWQWSEAEDDALQYLPHADQVLYLRGLRKHMDFTTGVVGDVRRVSYQMFSELLEVHRARGSTLPSERFDTPKIRAIFGRLETAGLVVRLNQGGRIGEAMVFRLPLATTVLNRLNEEQQGNNTEGTTQQNIGNSIPCDMSAAGEQHGMNNTPQYINKSSKDDCEKPEVSTVHVSGVGKCPHAEILALWRELLPGKPQPKPALWVVSQSARNLHSRWSQASKIPHSSGTRTLYHDRESGLAWWRAYFNYIATKCPFLTNDESGWMTLHWLVKKQNFLKVLDKTYENKNGGGF